MLIKVVVWVFVAVKLQLLSAYVGVLHVDEWLLVYVLLSGLIAHLIVLFRPVIIYFFGFNVDVKGFACVAWMAVSWTYPIHSVLLVLFFVSVFLANLVGFAAVLWTWLVVSMVLLLFIIKVDWTSYERWLKRRALRYVCFINCSKLGRIRRRLLDGVVAAIPISHLVIGNLYWIRQHTRACQRQYRITYLWSWHNLTWIQAVTLLKKLLCLWNILKTGINCVEHLLVHPGLFGFILFIVHFMGWRHHFRIQYIFQPISVLICIVVSKLINLVWKDYLAVGVGDEAVWRQLELFK